MTLLLAFNLHSLTLPNQNIAGAFIPQRCCPPVIVSVLHVRVDKRITFSVKPECVEYTASRLMPAVFSQI